MKRHERLTKLFEIISAQDGVSVEELVSALGVSAATIRRDLDQLAAQQLITRTHGGAAPSPTSSDLPLRYKSVGHRAQEKRKIAEKAAAMVHVGDVIALNGGTTTTEIARELALRPELRTDVTGEQVVVLTNAVNIANELAVRSHLRVVLTGGVVRPMSFELTGPLAATVLESVSVDTLFLGVDAINEAGTYTWHDGEAEINAKLVAQAHTVAVVADSSKLGARAFARICPLTNIDMLITDSDADPDSLATIREAGVEVVLV